MRSLTIPRELILSEEDNKVIISHVGDHEYSFNIFGSVHKNITKYLLKLAEYARIKPDKIKIQKITEITFEVFDTSFKAPYRIAFLSIEEIDPEEFPYRES